MASHRVRVDVFPAHVALSTGEVFDRVRIIVTLDTVFVFKDSSAGPVVAFSERLASYDPGNPPHRRTRSNPVRPALVTTDSDTVITFNRTGGCGCGSRLKSFNPFAASQLPTAASSKDS